MELEKKRKRFKRIYEKVRSTNLNTNASSAANKLKESQIFSQDIFKLKVA